MIFQIEYSRREGRLVSFRAFKESERRRAEDLRLELELDLRRRGVDHDVVLLEAESEALLRTTHRGYFVPLNELLQSVTDKLSVRRAPSSAVPATP